HWNNVAPDHVRVAFPASFTVKIDAHRPCTAAGEPSIGFQAVAPRSGSSDCHGRWPSLGHCGAAHIAERTMTTARNPPLGHDAHGPSASGVWAATITDRSGWLAVRCRPSNGR